MSTAISTHHRFSDPLAIAAIVVVVVGGASVLGVVVAGEDSAAPSAPAQTVTRVDEPPSARIGTDESPARVGLGDFTPTQSATHSAPLKGGHTVVGLP